MLANGAKFYYSATLPTVNQDGTLDWTGVTSWTEIYGLKEIPESGQDLEKVDNTALTDKNKHYELGIGDLGDTTYLFRYANAASNDSYRAVRTLSASGNEYSWKEVLNDGTTSKFTGKCSYKRTGAGVNGVIDVQLNIAVSSDYDITDPS